MTKRGDFMTIMRNISAALFVLGLAGTFCLPTTAPAQAQGFFNLFGPTGAHTVKFSKRYPPGTIIVSFGDRRLYHIRGKGIAKSYPIAIPTKKARWSGVSYVSQKRVNPPWTPTPEMRRNNPKLPAFVPGGHPRNPLGVRALYLGNTLYRIHGTDAPWLIGKSVSHGCIRMYNNDVRDLYARTKIGARVIVTWKRFRTASYNSW